MKAYIKGVFERYIYENNNYTIGVILIKDTNISELMPYISKSLTFTGYFDTLNEKEHYILYGDLVNHPKYGIQFNTVSYEKIKPDDIDGVKEFLASDLFSGIGDKMAASIVDILGSDALNKIIEDRSCLNLIPKLSIKKANLIYNTLIKYEESHKTIVYLTELGFTMHNALIIYNLYKNQTYLMIENNIYDILNKTNEISFTKIDEIALRNSVYDEINRVKACIIYIMNSLVYKNGDTYLIYNDIKNNVLDYLNYEIDDELFNDYLNELLYEGKIVIEDDKYFLLEMYKSELIVADKITKLNAKKKIVNKDIDNILNKLQERNEIIYNEKQLEAIKTSLENHISIITGGPGTGKTTIVRSIIDAYIELNNLDETNIIDTIALLAPTGRASKRLSETTNLPSYTIHRFLKWNKENNEFGVNEHNKCFHKLIILDEVSMVDINLFASLFKGIMDNIQLVLVGDYNQLPSVGPGQVLKDIIDSGVINIIKLDILYRQNNNSYIPILADNIKNDCVNEFTKTHNDYIFLSCNSNSIKNTLKELCNKMLNKNINLRNMQIMAPTYLGVNGIDALNKLVQDVFNPEDKEKLEIISGDTIYREDDKILQLVNMPDENVFNGDIGFISKIVPANISESKKTEIYIDFDGNIVMYNPKDFNKIKHGYVVSIHKSQGSEFDTVIIPICMSYSRMLYKKLLYTGITRAKKKLIIIGEEEAFEKGIKNNYEYIKKTTLKEKIMNNLKK